MKPFDLEEAKAGKPVCTRNGNDARIICWDCKGNPPTIVALVTYVDPVSGEEYEVASFYKINGVDLDDALFMKSNTEKRWAVYYKEVDDVSKCYKKLLTAELLAKAINERCPNSTQVIEFEIEV